MRAWITGPIVGLLALFLVAAAPNESNQIVDTTGAPVGTDANPFVTRPPAGASASTVGQGAAGAAPWPVTNWSSASGGISGVYRLPSSAATTNAALIAAGAHRVFKVYVCNTTSGINATTGYVKLYDAATTPVPGTTPVRLSRAVFAGTCASFDWADLGIQFTSGLGVAMTVDNADAGATPVGAAAMTQFSVEYQ